MSGLLLGVDGGATKTVALVASPTGEVLGAGRSGSSDIHGQAPPQVAVDHVEESVREALLAAGASVGELGATAFGLCGVDWPEDVAYYTREMTERLLLTTDPIVLNDAFNTLRAGRADDVGVALVVGTGAAVAARGPTGDTWFSGERIESSGASEFGRRAFDLIMRGEYGAGSRPVFAEAVLDAHGADSVDEMVHTITRVGGIGRRDLGGLAPMLFDAGDRGDPLSVDVIREQGALLGGYVRRAAERVGLGVVGTPVVLAGGVFRHHSTVLRDAIEAAIPHYSTGSAVVEPVHGAVLMAADLCGARPDTERLRSSGPDATFFETA